jgi:hypothetical protein
MDNYIDKISFSKYKDKLYSIEKIGNGIILGFNKITKGYIYYIQINKDIYDHNDSKSISYLVDGNIDSYISENGGLDVN